MSMLKEIVVCKFAGCNQVYNDARILPCGDRTCAAHIDSMMVKSDHDNDGKMIKCHFCEEIHGVPDNNKGFPVDKNIPLLLSMKYCTEHEAAKKSFNEVTKLLDKFIKLDKEDLVIGYFERVEADILLAKEANHQKLNAHYQELVEEVHKRKVKCLHNLKTNKTQLDAIAQELIEHEGQLKKDNIDFQLKTLDGDDAKWKAIQLECNLLLAKINTLGEELKRKLVADQWIQFVPNTRDTLIGSVCGHLVKGPIDSTIVSTDKLNKDLVELCKLSDKEFKLLYRATIDGFGASDFHGKCDNQPRTLTIIKTTKGYIFGGYTSIAWNDIGGYKRDDNAFVFSLVNASSLPLLIPVEVGDKHAIGCYVECGPIFGGGSDLRIAANSNINEQSKSDLGYSFKLAHFAFQSTEARSFLAGGFNFQTVEIEVYQLM